MNKNKKIKILFIDRDGTLIKESPPDYQIDSFEKLFFLKGMLHWLGKIALELDYELVMVSNQDGLGTDAYSEKSFTDIQQFLFKHLEDEKIFFSNVFIDKSTEKNPSAYRKPSTLMLKQYLDNEKYDLQNSFVIGDRLTDVELAKNLDCKAIWLNQQNISEDNNAQPRFEQLKNTIALETSSWQTIYEFLKLGSRTGEVERNTSETKINIKLNLDGSGKTAIDTGLHFFNHMLEQIGKHSGTDLEIKVNGDLQVDEHHTIEDTAIAMGECFAKALGNKMGIERYGFLLPMDECLAQVAIDFGGRSWLVWEVDFKREKIGDVPTEMFYHFFKSFSDASKCNLNIKAEGENEHHKIESVFKGFAKAIKMAIKRDAENSFLPSTKGKL